MLHPENDLNTLVARFREITERAPWVLELLPGLTDAELNTFPLPVPEPERDLLQRFRGFVLTIDPGGSYRMFFGPGSTVDPGDPGPKEPEHTPLLSGQFSNIWHTVPGDLAILLHTNDAAERFYVDVDASSGRWGGVFGDSPDYGGSCEMSFLARSVIDWWNEIAKSLLAEINNGRILQDRYDYQIDDDEQCGCSTPCSCDFEDLGSFLDNNPAFSNSYAPWSGNVPVIGYVEGKQARHLFDRATLDQIGNLPDDSCHLFDLRAVHPPVRLYRSTKSVRLLRRGGGAFAISASDSTLDRHNP
ncbi:hypothetical protein IU440_08115 [Nocardia cyriacigeorgica]|uniref:hypothetical protein n=1 Tax=Nocardia cyriacigeorgica TaxID=135487 RepID=UPI00189439B0|nr:hypothetical protein [Nocardia cyriacigeorgica]MBF6290187.1 hypothetical protein [Nocardia cyriacigeorgica]MBF6424645.1 hypothetical protein [Nocardia cyriacigeorgica]